MENHEVTLSMTIINNIQAMERMINANRSNSRNKTHSFSKLSKKTYKELQTMQDELVDFYNDALRDRRLATELTNEEILHANN